MIFPTFREYEKISRKFNLVPIFDKIAWNKDIPILSVIKAKIADQMYLLESSQEGHIGRYSFVGYDPFLIYRFANGVGTIELKGKINKIRGTPLEILRKTMRRYKAPEIENLPSFYGGAVGYLSYDSVRYVEKLPNLNRDDLQLPQAYFLLSNVILIFDNQEHTLKIVVNTVEDENTSTYRYRRAIQIIDAIKEKISTITNTTSQKHTHSNFKTTKTINFKSNMSKETFETIVNRAKEYIRAGDIFQVVLSQRWEAPLELSPLMIYKNLRTLNPSPYMFYLKCDDFTIIGSSPEMLVKVESGVIETNPIAGTRPRTRDSRINHEIAKNLLNDEKERAEHVMLVDLSRNDIGRVCKPKSVKIEEFMKVKSFSHVMHIVTKIKGHLRNGIDDFDVLEATFPAGTVSGAPKVRAMEIIEELEPVRRGPYAGIVGYFSFTGNLDSCLIIRSLVIKDSKVYWQAGAGIVADSMPDLEYMETINKAQAMLKALTMRGDGDDLDDR